MSPPLTKEQVTEAIVESRRFKGLKLHKTACACPPCLPGPKMRATMYTRKQVDAAKQKARNDALEAACQAVCQWCMLGLPVSGGRHIEHAGKPFLPGESNQGDDRMTWLVIILTGFAIVIYCTAVIGEAWQERRADEYRNRRRRYTDA